jgi:ZIP family zinc transporter
MNLPDNLPIALLLTTLAGLSTGIGAAISFFIRKPKMVYLSFSLGFSAGVMIYISFVELLPHGIAVIGGIAGICAFFLGMVFIGMIDMAIPEGENPHAFKEPRNDDSKSKNLPWNKKVCEFFNKCTRRNTCEKRERGECCREKSKDDKRICRFPRRDAMFLRTAIFLAVAIGIHNLPEGLATLGTTLTSVKFGILTTLAIALHNIPEGISVSVPIYYATGSRKKAFYYSFLSGLAEPIGAAVGVLILLPFLSPALLAGLLAFVAGIMIYVSLDELLPLAHRCGHSHAVIIGIGLGMFVMAASIVIFKM